METHSIVFIDFLRMVTLSRATEMIRVFIRSWKAEESMCWSARKLRLFCAKKTKPGTAYCAKSPGSTTSRLRARSSLLLWYIRHHPTAATSLISSEKKYTHHLL